MRDVTRLDKLRHLYAAVGEEIEREEKALIRRQALVSEIAVPWDETPDIVGQGGQQGRGECGTDAGYKGHRYHGEQPCGACYDAHAETNARYRQKVS